MPRGALRIFAVTAALFCPLGARAADNPALPEMSKRNCRAWADAAADKLAKEFNFSAKSRDSTSERNLAFCLWAEGESLKALDIILPIATESMVRSCARRVSDEDSEGLRKTLDCLNRTLQSLSDGQLPRGAATLYRNASPVRFWRLSDCVQARQPGEACTIQ